MPPHLHPRSASTTSLFGATLAVSFLVVGLPHLLPCPVSPHALAEGEMEGVPNKPRRRRMIAPQTKASDETGAGSSTPEDNNNPSRPHTTREIVELSRKSRECPVPKPQGLIGHLLGFEKKEGAERIDIRIQPLRERGVAAERDANR